MYGSAGYRAPEVTSEGCPNHLADQFSASVILYQLLTGALPYDGLGGDAAQFDSVPPIVLPSPSNPEVWPRLDSVTVMGLSLDPKGRFATTRTWLEALRDASESRPALSLGPLVFKDVIRRATKILRRGGGRAYGS